MSPFRRPALIAPTALFLALAACATNKLRVEYAGQVATQGKAAALASNQFLDTVATTRRDANIDLFAADPACANPRARLRDVPQTGTAPGAICRLAAEAEDPADTPITLRPLTDELRPTIELIDALASYCDALAAIVAADTADPGQQFEDAVVTANAAQALLIAVLDTKPKPRPGPIPPKDDPRIAALKNFITFLGELAKEQAQVDALRDVIAADPAGASLIIDELISHLKVWENARKGDEGLRTGIVGAQLNRVAEAAPPLSATDRRAAMQTFYARSDAANLAGRLFPKLLGVLLTLKATDDDLRRVLKENPNLTPAERARVAEFNRQRLVHALNSFTAIINAFRRP